MNQRKYPIGEFMMPDVIENGSLTRWINDLRDFPSQLNRLISVLSKSELQQFYRPGGWNITQVVHHCADSHMNAFIRCKLALTEDNPTIKDYYEADWAELPDATLAAMEDSIHLLKGLHLRWVFLFENLREEQWKRTYFHPGQQRKVTLLEVLGMYSWHSRHHLTHIKQAIDEPFHTLPDE